MRVYIFKFHEICNDPDFCNIYEDKGLTQTVMVNGVLSVSHIGDKMLLLITEDGQFSIPQDAVMQILITVDEMTNDLKVL
jgi:hypothetical protein